MSGDYCCALRERVEQLRDELFLAAHAQHGAEIPGGVRKLLDKIDAALAEDHEPRPVAP